MSKFWCFGHRGAMGYEPENTLRSFARAIELGVDAIELDVYNIGEQLIVFHDETLERTTNGSGRIFDHSLKDLRKLDAGQGEKIPLLSEVLDLVNRKVVVNIEIKGANCSKLVADTILSYCQNHGWKTEDFLVSSFDHPQLKAISNLIPTLRIGALIYGIPLDYAQCASSLKAYSLHVSSEFINSKLVLDAKARGLKVFTYTVNGLSEFELVRDIGVDGVFTNFPDRLIAQAKSL